MAINTNSAMYKGLLDKGYTASEIQQMYNDVSAGKNAKEVVSAMDAQKAKSSTSTPKTENITYNGQVSDGNKSGTANMNSMSQNKAIDNSRNFQVGTGDVVDMPKQQTTSLNQTASSGQKFAQSWDSMSATQQKNALSRSKALNDYIASKGLTVKKEETPTQTTTKTTATTPKKTTTTPKQDQWDYQDNSQARMDEIARNLNGYRVTNPDLFKDPSAFYTFFIDGKGRSQDQIDYLWDYFNNVQKYGKYDNMAPDAIGNGLTDGSIPEDYLDYLKSIDPNKYQEVIAARQNAQDTIKYEDYLNSTAALAGMEGYESEPSSIKYGKYNEIWMDEDSNGIDDRREHYASEEEQGYQKQIADINARNLDIDNTVKHTYEDYVKKYPGATKSTLMAMAQDTNATLLREKENNLVELTRLQGYVKYMQEERFEMNEAGADSIRQLQDNLKMYYQYSPEGMAELAQAQYAATNITLDQADNGTETQQQMAIEAAITPIYNQYADIIQRSPAEVINDVIAYAKKNGVGLRQALEENFMKPLREKDAYKAMQNQLVDSGWDIKNIYVDGEQQSVWYNPQTGETKPIGYSYNSSTGKFDTIAMNDWGEGDYQKNRGAVQEAMRDWASGVGSKEAAAQAITANMEGTYLGTKTCGYYVNDYIYGMTGQKGPFGSEIASKRAACTNTGLKGAKVGDAIVFDWNIAGGIGGVYPEYGHVGIITGYNPSDGSLQVSSSVGGKVQTKTIKPGDAWYKNIYGTMSVGYNATPTNFGYGENPMSEQIADIRANVDLNASQKEDLLFASQAYGIMYDLASNGGIDHLLNSSDGQKMLANLKNAKFIKNGENATGSQVMDAIKNGISDQRNLQTVNDLISVIELKLRKTSGAAIAASEWSSNFDMLLPAINEDYDVAKHKYERFENTYLREYFNSAGSGIDGYNYKSLFSPNSPYYKRDDSTSQVGNTSKGTWNITTQKDGGTVVAGQSNSATTSKGTRNTSAKTGQGSTVSSNDPYASLYSLLGY